MAAEWVEVYGNWAVFVGGVLEGEATFIAAGYAISQGYLHPVPTLLLAVLGGSLGDHLFYGIGSIYGGPLIRGVPWLRRLRARATLLLRRWGRAAPFLIRFGYGLRIILPMCMGVARFPGRLFFPFNLLGALVFAMLYLSVGYFFGELVEQALARTRGHQAWIPIVILGLGALGWLIREWRLLYGDPGEPHRER